MKTLTALTLSLALAASVMGASAQDNSNQPTGKNGPRGAGRGYGLRNATGPHAQMGTCPMVNDNPPAAVAPAPGNRGPGFGVGNRGGNGQGQRGGWVCVMAPEHEHRGADVRLRLEMRLRR